MKKQTDSNNEPEDLLDQVVAGLRNQPVPPMPPELLVFAKSTVTENAPRKRFPISLSLLAVAAAALLVASANYFLPPVDPDHTQVAEMPDDPNSAEDELSDRGGVADEIVVVGLSSSPMFSAMDAALDELNAEIDQLRRPAELLDARRRATELTDSLATLD